MTQFHNHSKEKRPRNHQKVSRFRFHVSRESGFTLVEVLVALTIFVAIFAMVSGYLVSAISGQREALAVRPMVNETSFLAEYLSRALRPAQKAQNADCLSAAGMYYERSVAPETVRFIDRDEKCREISYDSIGERIVERISTTASSANFGPAEALTSPGLQVQSLRFEVSPPPSSAGIPHPRITFTVELRPAGDVSVQTLSVQTSVSQREF